MSDIPVAICVSAIVNGNTKCDDVIFRVQKSTSFREILQKAWWSGQGNGCLPTEEPSSIKVWNNKENIIKRHLIRACVVVYHNFSIFSIFSKSFSFICFTIASVLFTSTSFICIKCHV